MAEYSGSKFLACFWIQWHRGGGKGKLFGEFVFFFSGKLLRECLACTSNFGTRLMNEFPNIHRTSEEAVVELNS